MPEARIVSFDAVLCMFRGSSTEEYPASESFTFSFALEILSAVPFSVYPCISIKSENLSLSSLERPFATETSS